MVNDVSRLKEVGKVTFVYLMMYYVFVFGQSLSKRYIFKKLKSSSDESAAKLTLQDVKYRSTDKIALTGDRTVGNTLEQAIPFLTSLWLHAVFVDPSSAAKYGWYYIAFRAIYPVVFYYGTPYLYLSTFTGYGIIIMLLKPLWEAFSN